MAISIAHIFLYGNESMTVDMSGMSSDLLFEKDGGDLSLVHIDESVTMQGVVKGVLSLAGTGAITLTERVVCRNLNRDDFTGTMDLNGFWFDYCGSVFWVFSKTSNLFDMLHVLAGGIR